MKLVTVEDLKENDLVEGIYKGFLVKGRVKTAFGSRWLEVKARPGGGHMRLPLSQIEIPRKLTRKKGVSRV